MRLSVLERLLVVSRPRPRMSPELGLFTPPIATRYPSSSEEGPWLTSISTGAYVVTKIREGEVGQAFFKCLADEEDPALGRLYDTLWSLSEKFQWRNRASSISEGLAWQASVGLEPRNLVVPFASLSHVVGQDLTPEEADKISLSKGCIAEIGSVRVISARDALPAGAAIITAAPSLTGWYTRIQEFLGVTLMRADRSTVLIRSDVD